MRDRCVKIYTRLSVGGRFLGQVVAAEESACFVEGFDRCEETLQAREVFLAFDRDQGVRSFETGLAPAPGDLLSIRSGVGYLQQAKAGGFEQAFIFAGRTEKV